MASPTHYPTHYEVLGVAPSATPEQVRAAYRAAARDHHPDAGGDPDRMRALNAAWWVLGDPARRAAYDRQLGEPAAGSADGFVAAEDDGADGADVADLADDRPIRQTVALEGWPAILPPATLVGSTVLFGVSFLFASREMLALSAVGFILALGLFALAPLRAMTRRR